MGLSANQKALISSKTVRAGIWYCGETIVLVVEMILANAILALAMHCEWPVCDTYFGRRIFHVIQTRGYLFQGNEDLVCEFKCIQLYIHVHGVSLLLNTLS